MDRHVIEKRDRDGEWGVRVQTEKEGKDRKRKKKEKIERGLTAGRHL